MDRWISVLTQLPALPKAADGRNEIAKVVTLSGFEATHSEAVLVWIPAVRMMTVAVFNLEGKWEDWSEISELEGVTHWLALPPPPPS